MELQRGEKGEPGTHTHTHTRADGGSPTSLRPRRGCEGFTCASMRLSEVR